MILGGCEDLDVMEQATEGVDAVAHLGAIPGESSFHKVVAKHAATVWQAKTRGTGYTLKQHKK